ncbi:MAG: DUF983 domain-containing protein [Sphingomonadaceae bacterium]|nr:DUF983 domain-containing protein [Sphingomonadaceae bacterium]
MEQPTLLQIGLSGLCPQCGAPTLYEGPITFADNCANCGLDISEFNVGDGPAAFLTLIIGALVMALALTLELTLYPPFWVHILLWVPITAAAVVFGLRLAKGMLLASEYRNQAREGRISGKDDE